MTTHQRHLAQGLCYDCGKRPPAPTKSGKPSIRCAVCQEKHRKYQNEHLADYMRKADDDAQVMKCLTCDIPAEYCKGENCERQRQKFLAGKKP